MNVLFVVMKCEPAFVLLLLERSEVQEAMKV